MHRHKKRQSFLLLWCEGCLRQSELDAKHRNRMSHNQICNCHRSFRREMIQAPRPHCPKLILNLTLELLPEEKCNPCKDLDETEVKTGKSTCTLVSEPYSRIISRNALRFLFLANHRLPFSPHISPDGNALRFSYRTTRWLEPEGGH
jgi:phage FluMu protein Com